MSSEHTSTAIGVVLCAVLAAAGVYCMFGTVKREATQQVQQQQQSATFGPFDDANADLVGVPKTDKSSRLRLP